MERIRVAAGLIFLLAGLAVAARAAAADPDILWKIVSQKCVPKAEAGGDPAPCRLVDLAGRYAVLKDIEGPSQYLVIPTDRVTGIESPLLENPATPNYFAAAWEARRYMSESLGKPVPRDDVGLAINSQKGRSQNQLHIHVDCVDPATKRAVSDNQDAVTAGWAAFPARLAGHAYTALRIEASDLKEVYPFRLLADGNPAARADMGDETLVAIATTFKDGNEGFVLLADHADLASLDRASGEDLLDHGCAILKE
jgi:CDP-diacylglycerol pyrophosphatase